MLQAIIGALCGVGLFFVLADVYRIPYLKTSKAVESLSKKQKVKTSTLNVWLGNLADFLAKHMKLNEFKKAQLEADLKTAQMDITPEKFKANAIVKALLKLAELLNISDTQLSYITNVEAGRGLMKVGSALVPFVNKFPKNTKLYALMTTKFGER